MRFLSSLQLQYEMMKEKIEEQQNDLDRLYHAAKVYPSVIPKDSPIVGHDFPTAFILGKDIQKKELKFEITSKILAGFGDTSSIVQKENFRIIKFVNVSR